MTPCTSSSETVKLHRLDADTPVLSALSNGCMDLLHKDSLDFKGMFYPIACMYSISQ